MVEFGTSSAFRGWVRILGYGCRLLNQYISARARLKLGRSPRSHIALTRALRARRARPPEVAALQPRAQRA